MSDGRAAVPLWARPITAMAAEIRAGRVSPVELLVPRPRVL
jgi:hypothetical protein